MTLHVKLRAELSEEGNKQDQMFEVFLVIVVVVTGIIGMLGFFVFSMHNPQPPFPPKTTTGLLNQFQPPQEAVYRLQDVNTCRIQVYNSQSNKAPDQRNLGMAELIGQKTDRSTVVLYTTPIFWGSHAGGHSETLAAADVENFLDTHSLDKDITGLHMLVVSQYNICITCVKNTRGISASMRQHVSPVTLVTTMWQVNAYIDPLDPKTWVALSSPGDITRVDLHRR